MSSFPDTLWTQLIDVIQREPPDSLQRRAAYGNLYMLYRSPVLNHIRRLFYAGCFRHASADDLTNEFFAHLIEKDSLAGVSRDKGTFRAWLKRSAENFCRNQGVREQAMKRGKAITDPLDNAPEPGVDDMVLAEAGRIFDRTYARKLYPAVIEELLAEYRARGQGPLFDDLRGFILTDSENEYQLLAHKHCIRYEAIATAVNRLRKRFGLKLKHRITEDLVDPTAEDIEDEVRHLILLLSEGAEQWPCASRTP
jgi:RNA polymerase sigma-70 factor (ECF subfamily)